VVATYTADLAEIPAVAAVVDAPIVLSKLGVFGTVVRRAAPRLVEASLIPTALFYCCLVFVGLGAAYAAALCWLYAAVAARLLRGRPVPPMVVLAAIGITVRTMIAVASGSSFFYFAQPVLGSVVMGTVFLGSIFIGRPMVERLALEFWAITPEQMARPAVLRLLRGLTFLWAAVNILTAAATLTLLLWLPLATYVAVKPLVGWAIIGVGIAVTIDLAIRTARREGFVAERTPRLRSVPLAPID